MLSLEVLVKGYKLGRVLRKLAMFQPEIRRLELFLNSEKLYPMQQYLIKQLCPKKGQEKESECAHN